MASRLSGPWKVDFFKIGEAETSIPPVQAWLDSLPEAVRGKVLARLELLRREGPTLDFPYTSQIEGKLREARLRMGKTRYRVLYFFDDDRTAVLLHGFTKDTAAVEDFDKRIALTRMAQHQSGLQVKKAAMAAKKKQGKGN